MTRKIGYRGWILLTLAALGLSCGRAVPPGQSTAVDRPPRIHPDYTDVTIPPNIAPLNFQVQEAGQRYFVRAHSTNGAPLQVGGRSSKIRLPSGAWHSLLAANRGQPLYFDIYVQTAGGPWQQFRTVTNTIATEDIDPYLLYRKIRPLHNRWSEMSLEQRNVETFQTRTIIHSRSLQHGCVNCHTLLHNDANTMLLHGRTPTGTGMVPALVLIRNGQAGSVKSNSQFGGAPMGHSAWHPSGKLIVYTVYKVRQFFHTAATEIREGMDLDAGLGYYLVDSDEMKTTPALARKDRLETFPTWSPDGKYLYFCSAPIWWTDQNKLPPRFDEIRYDLLRIPYDLSTDTWGEPEVVLAAEKTGMSIVQPRISPDGRFLVFGMCDYSCFPTFRENSDLYLMDLQTRQYTKLDCNSPQPESWHCWSSNGKWLAFSSKRGAVLFNRVYFSYIDSDGRSRKPFVLPQQDPTFDDSYMRLYQLPELARNPMPIRGEPLARLLRHPTPPGHLPIPITGATPKAPASSQPPADYPMNQH
jgi:hypothetical protein